MITIFIIILYLTGAVHAVDAIMHRRSSQGAVAWSVSLLVFPFLALPCYWTFGSRHFESYSKRLKSCRSEFDSLFDQSTCDPKDEEVPAEFRCLENLNNSRFTGQNQVALLVEGGDFFKALFDELKQATSSIHLEYYLFNSDSVGQKIKEILIEKAKKGIEIFLIVDQVGSFYLEDEFLSELENAGIKTARFSTNKRLLRRLRLNFRNHRKIAIIDKKIAFIGSHNVGEHYCDTEAPMGKVLDCSIRVRGEIVTQIFRAFAEDWYWVREEVLQFEPEKENENLPTSPLFLCPTGPAGTTNIATLYLLHLITQAKESITLTTPYLAPGETIKTALKLAARKGVKVKLFVPKRSNLWLAQCALYACCFELVDSGVQIYEYTPGFIHQKVVLVDQRAASIGSINLDNRSLELNFELAALTTDPKLIKQVAEMLATVEAESSDIREKLSGLSYGTRVIHQLAQLCEPIL